MPVDSRKGCPDLLLHPGHGCCADRVDLDHCGFQQFSVGCIGTFCGNRLRRFPGAVGGICRRLSGKNGFLGLQQCISPLVVDLRLHCIQQFLLAGAEHILSEGIPLQVRIKHTGKKNPDCFSGNILPLQGESVVNSADGNRQNLQISPLGDVDADVCTVQLIEPGGQCGKIRVFPVGYTDHTQRNRMIGHRFHPQGCNQANPNQIGLEFFINNGCICNSICQGFSEIRNRHASPPFSHRVPLYEHINLLYHDSLKIASGESEKKKISVFCHKKPRSPMGKAIQPRGSRSHPRRHSKFSQPFAPRQRHARESAKGE